MASVVMLGMPNLVSMKLQVENMPMESSLRNTKQVFLSTFTFTFLDSQFGVNESSIRGKPNYQVLQITGSRYNIFE